MNMNRVFAVTAVCMVVLATLPLGFGVGEAASSSLDSDDALSAWGGKATPATADLFDRSGDFAAKDWVVTHGDGLPGWYVSYDVDDDDAYANLEDWIDSSDDRTLLEHDQEDGRVLVAAPGEHIRRSSLWGVDGLVTRSWVEWVEVEQRVELVEPVNLETSDEIEREHAPSRTAKVLAGFDGAFATDDDGAKGVAYSGDVNRTDMSDVKQAIAADSDSIPASADGDTVTYAVLDTGANVGEAGDRGLVFGNGTAGSDPRIDWGKNFVTNESINRTKTAENRTYDAIEDGNLHGTYTAARIAGSGGGDPGLASPANESTLAIGKVLGDDGSGSIQNIVAGLEWASNSSTVDADVISMSLGSPRYSKVLEDEIHEALEDEDVSAVVVAAGNARWTTGRDNVGSPADADGVVTVAATTTNNSSDGVEIAYFSNTGPDDGVKDGSNGETRGELPDLGSPGMENTVYVIDAGRSGRNATMSGTSMATPDVAMAAGLLVDEHATLRGDHEAVRDRLLDTADPAPEIGYTEIGNGLLNVSNVLDGTEPGETQRQVRTEQAKARDQANEALAGRLATYLKSKGLEL